MHHFCSLLRHQPFPRKLMRKKWIFSRIRLPFKPYQIYYMSLILKNSDTLNTNSGREEVWGFTYYAWKRSASFLYPNQQIAQAGQHMEERCGPLFSTLKLLLGKKKLSWTRKETPFVRESTANSIVSYQNRYNMIDSRKTSLISDMFLTYAKSSNAKSFDRRYHCCCACWQDLLSVSFFQKRVMSMWLISKAGH